MGEEGREGAFMSVDPIQSDVLRGLFERRGRRWQFVADV